MYKVIDNCIDCSELLTMINFKINDCELHNINLFYPNFGITFLNSNSPINRMLQLANKYNPFVNSLYTFKNCLKLNV